MQWRMNKRYSVTIFGPSNLLWVQRSSSEAEHSFPSTAEVKNEWSHNSTPTHAVRAWRSVTLPIFTFHHQTPLTIEIWKVLWIFKLLSSGRDPVSSGTDLLVSRKSLQRPTALHLPRRWGGVGGGVGTLCSNAHKHLTFYMTSRHVTTINKD
jgi:hypothetical protein